MHDYLLSSEWIRFAFVFGVVVSMVMYEKRHLTTGSIVVPGYIAVFIIHPAVIVATFLNAFLTYAIVNKVLRRYFLLYGRTKFALLAVISTMIQTAMLRITPSGQWLWEHDIPLFIGVGYIVPALIAHDMARQGVWKTTKSVVMAGVIVATPIALALVLDLPGVNELAPIDGFGTTAIDVKWLPVAVALSVAASWAVAINYGLRSGGFVGAAFVGMFMADPWQVVAALAIAAATWAFVSKVLMHHMILFGRRKFSAMLLVSSVLTWGGLWIGGRIFEDGWESHFAVGSLALTPLLLPGLLANDAQRTSPARVLLGVTMASTFAVTTTWWIQTTITDETLHLGWKLLSLASFGSLFAKQLVALPTALARRLRRRQTELVPAADAGAEYVEPPATDWFAPWTAWAKQHPRAAHEAEIWLSAQLAKFASAPLRPSPAIAHDLTATVLLTALDEQRGQRRVPRSPAPSTPISETSDAAREAQLAASDVSDHTSETREMERPLLGF